MDNEDQVRMFYIEFFLFILILLMKLQLYAFFIAQQIMNSDNNVCVFVLIPIQFPFCHVKLCAVLSCFSLISTKIHLGLSATYIFFCINSS